MTVRGDRAVRDEIEVYTCTLYGMKNLLPRGLRIKRIASEKKIRAVEYNRICILK